MPRPQKGRRVCQRPMCRRFDPIDSATSESVILNLDELETIRLLDLVGLSQEATGMQMNIGRATVQRIYEDARRKIADALVNAKSLQIEGGNVDFCDGCEPSLEGDYDIPRGETMNKIAIPVSGNEIFGHFGHAPQFKLVSVEGKSVVSIEIIDAPPHQHGFLPGFLAEKGVDTVIANTLGQGAIDRFNALSITLYSGLSGDADDAVKAVLSGEAQPNAKACGHNHGDGHHGHPHGQHHE